MENGKEKHERGKVLVFVQVVTIGSNGLVQQVIS